MEIKKNFRAGHRICVIRGKKKIRYSRQTGAESARRKLLMQQTDERNPHALVTYECLVCKGWHVGHSRVMERVFNGKENS